MKRLLPIFALLCAALLLHGGGWPVKFSSHGEAWYHPPGFVIEGDSISDTDGNRWPVYFMPLMSARFAPTNVAFDNFATSGDTASNMVLEYASQPHTVAASRCLMYFSIMAGINDLDAGDTAVNIEGNLSNLYTFARRDGYRVVAYAISPNYNWTNGDPRAVQWTNLNIWVRANSSQYDYLVPMDTALTNTDFSDGLHPSAAGALKLATVVSNTLF